MTQCLPCDSLTIGGDALKSLLAKNVKDQCINSGFLISHLIDKGYITWLSRKIFLQETAELAI